MSKYTEAQERNDTSFLVGANFGREAERKRILDALLPLVEQLNEYDGHPSVLLDGHSPGGLLGHALTRLAEGSESE